VLGGAVTPALDQLVKFIDPFTHPAAYWGVYTAVLWPFVSLTHGLANIIRKYNPSSFVKKLVTKEPYKDTAEIVTGMFEKETVKETFKISAIFGLPILAVHYLLPTTYLIPALVPLRTAYRYITGKTEKRKAAQEAAQGGAHSNNVAQFPQQAANDNQSYQLPDRKAA